MIGAFALTEADAGSDSFNLSTKAEKKGDKWILNGEKVWITNGAIADVFSVFARTEGDHRLRGAILRWCECRQE